MASSISAQEYIPPIAPGQFPPPPSYPPGTIIEGPVIQGQVIPQVIEGQPLQERIVPGSIKQIPPSTSPLPSTRSLPAGETIISREATPPVPASGQSASGTAVGVNQTLTRLLQEGGIPDTITRLRDLEVQQRKVASAAAACTVSVEIGPAQGCGVIVDEKGYILTAAHVAMRPGKIANITLSNGRRVRARTLGMDRTVDAGLMKIEPGQNQGQPWPRATLGTSQSLIAGMWCIATGHPGGYDGRRGTVTRVGRILEVRKKAIVTDCALIGGDSGGPLFDISGRLIAVHSRIGNDVSENLHVPIDLYEESWERMQRGEAWGYLEGFRPVLGLSGSRSSELAVVDTVNKNSPAEKAGVKVNDIVEQFGETMITDFASLQAAVANTMPGERLLMWINRGGRRIRLKVEVGRAD